MNNFRRLSVAFLLVLLLIGLSGHLLAPASGSHHTLAESNCAIHQGVNLPTQLQSPWNESGMSPEPTRDDTCVLDLASKISHPPTL
jgi:hypothetical protein